MSIEVWVQATEWLSIPAAEALLDVSDGQYHVAAFCQPCSIREGQWVQEPLLALDCKEIYIAGSGNPFAKRAEPGLGAQIGGTVTSVTGRLVAVGKIRITLDMPL